MCRRLLEARILRDEGRSRAETRQEERREKKKGGEGRRRVKEMREGTVPLEKPLCSIAQGLVPKGFSLSPSQEAPPLPMRIKKHGPIVSGGRDLPTPMKGCRHKPQTTGGGDRGHRGSCIRGLLDLGRVRLHYMYTHVHTQIYCRTFIILTV